VSKAESGKPETAEFAEYYGRYVGKIEGTDILAELEKQLDSTLAALRRIDERKGDFRYQPGKWSIKEVIGHMIDCERVFAYRALVFSRNDNTALPGFDQDKWAGFVNYSNVPLADIIDEFEVVRRSTILLFRHMQPDAWTRRGNGNGKDMTTRSAAFIIAGHVQHHLEILRTRYLTV
jgi:hypothetical protein